MTTYMICDEHGNEISDGHSDETVWSAARRAATRLGTTVYVSENGADAEDTAVEPE